MSMHEFEMLRQIYGLNSDLPAHVTLPPGDDMGGVQLSGSNVLVTVDQVADGVHVDCSTTSWQRVGRKAMTRNLSDVAAMAARPVGAVVAASLPRTMTQADAMQLFEAMRQVGRQYECPLFGGDISMWDGKLLISVTVLAEPAAGVEPVTRRGAHAGDVLYVTGELGGSSQDVGGAVHHLDFEPRIGLAQELARNFPLRCMIDLSDGLARDSGHLADAAELSVTLDAAQLPTGKASQQAAAQSGKPAWQHALGDGEDYELCFAVAPDVQMPAQLDGVKITRVGTFGPRHELGAVLVREPGGAVRSGKGLGWEHAGDDR